MPQMALRTNTLRLKGIPFEFGEAMLEKWLNENFGTVLYVEIFRDEKTLDNGRIIRLHNGEGAIVFEKMETQQRFLQASVDNLLIMKEYDENLISSSAEIMRKYSLAHKIKNEAAKHYLRITHPNKNIRQMEADQVTNRRLATDVDIKFHQNLFRMSTERKKIIEDLARVGAVIPLSVAMTKPVIEAVLAHPVCNETSSSSASSSSASSRPMSSSCMTLAVEDRRSASSVQSNKYDCRLVLPTAESQPNSNGNRDQLSQASVELVVADARSSMLDQSLPVLPVPSSVISVDSFQPSLSPFPFNWSGVYTVDTNGCGDSGAEDSQASSSCIRSSSSYWAAAQCSTISPSRNSSRSSCRSPSQSDYESCCSVVCRPQSNYFTEMMLTDSWTLVTEEKYSTCGSQARHDGPQLQRLLCVSNLPPACGFVKMKSLVEEKSGYIVEFGRLFFHHIERVNINNGNTEVFFAPCGSGVVVLSKQKSPYRYNVEFMDVDVNIENMARDHPMFENSLKSYQYEKHLLRQLTLFQRSDIEVARIGFLKGQQINIEATFDNIEKDKHQYSLWSGNTIHLDSQNDWIKNYVFKVLSK